MSLRMFLLLDSHSTREGKAFYRAQWPELPQIAAAELRKDACRDADLLIFVDDRTLTTQAWLMAFVEASQRHLDAEVLVARTDMFYTTMPAPDIVTAFPELTTGFAYPLPTEEDTMVKGRRPFLLVNSCVRMPAIDEIAFVSPRHHVWTVAKGATRIVWLPSVRVPRWSAPEETQAPALASYLRALGAASALEHSRDREWESAPRWAWRRYGETMLSTRLGLVGSPPSPIYSAYVPTEMASRQYWQTLWWREHQYFRGLVRPGRKMSASWPAR
jgi:hypothetical protein